MAEGHGALSDPRSAIASAVASLPPPHVISDLLSVGAVKVGVSSFRIRLIYYHSKASMDLQNSLAKAQGSKRRKTELISRVDVEVLNEGIRNECNHNEQAKNESDAVTRRILSSLPDDVFCEHFLLPPEKVKEPCSLRTMCYRMPIYIGGRYLKFSRKVSQSRWIIDDERMGETSVEEIIGSNVLLVCKGDSYKFHAAGREDIDVRMLGSGRPFLVEVSNARSMLSSADTQEIAEKINGSEHKYVKVRDLRVIGSEAWTLMREGEAEKQKQYAALVWISRPLTEEDQQKLTSTKDMEILQRTPIRVLHRRSPMDRRRMTAEKITGSSQYFVLNLCTQAGTYIKEFVHGDLGRTHPSIGTILGCRAEILQLDVTDVKMDCFD
ncbi:hypothetical protein Taro_045906 [Colocasia esculenta]|uniref:tRNA pseudouridine(55) synthase n=1 Tax=Colocasia esculenta TaxID=4460 RepID=A0A843WQS6_COLES|nr:hypothetical protein [Colocasia esculenta]